jgi:hypothetical protein
MATSQETAQMTVVSLNAKRGFDTRIANMVETDRDGAIDAMIKALRALGVVQTFMSTKVVSAVELAQAPDIFEEMVNHDLADRLGSHLHQSGHLTFATSGADYDATMYSAKLTVLKIGGRV